MLHGILLTYATSYMHGFSFSVHNSAGIQLVASTVSGKAKELHRKLTPRIYEKRNLPILQHQLEVLVHIQDV